MEKVKGVAKSGWHPPGKDGKKESWRGDFKGINQVVRHPIIIKSIETEQDSSLTSSNH